MLSRLPRVTPSGYRRITLVALVALGFIIVTGGAVRLTGSGLGCPQWPNCTTGHLAPPKVSPTGYHGAVEFVNRVITGVVSVAVIVAVLASLVRVPRRKDLTWLSAGLVLGVVGQIVLGGETVRHKLNPAFVAAHFLLSMLIVWDAVVLDHRASLPDGAPRRALVEPELVWAGRLMAVLAGVTIIAGTVVTGSGPHGGDDKVQRWSLDLHRVTQLHGTAAMLLVALTVATLWLLRSQGAPAAAIHRGRQVIEALALQVAIGYTQYFTGVPVVLVGCHILGAVLVWTAVLRFALVLGMSPAPAAQAGRPAGAGPRPTWAAAPPALSPRESFIMTAGSGP